MRNQFSKSSANGGLQAAQSPLSISANQLAETKPNQLADTKPNQLSDTKQNQLADTKPNQLADTKPNQLTATLLKTKQFSPPKNVDC